MKDPTSKPEDAPRESVAEEGAAAKRRGHISVPLRLRVAASDLAHGLDPIIEALDDRLARALAKSRAMLDDRHPGATPVPTVPRFTWYGPAVASVPAGLRQAVEQRIAELITRQAASQLQSSITAAHRNEARGYGQKQWSHAQSVIDTEIDGWPGENTANAFVGPQANDLAAGGKIGPTALQTILPEEVPRPHEQVVQQRKPALDQGAPWYETALSVILDVLDVARSPFEAPWDIAGWLGMDALIESALHGAQPWILDTVTSRWPAGSHVVLESHAGVTPILPIHVAKGGSLEIAHAGKGVLTMTRRFTGTLAFDTGIGIAIVGGSSRNTPGAAAAAEFQAGGTARVTQTFRFDLREDGSLAGLYEALTSEPMVEVSRDTLMLLAGAGGGLSRFVESSKVELDVSAQGDARGSLFLTNPGEKTPTGQVQKTRERGGGLDTGEQSWWQRFLSIGGSATLGLGYGVAMETRRESGQTVIELSGEASAVARAAGSIPGLPALHLGGELAGGVKLTIPVMDADAPHARDRFGKPTYTLYTKTGEWEDWRGPASETAFSMRDGFDDDGGLALDDLLQSIDAITIRRRMGVGGTLGQRLRARLHDQRATRALLPGSYRNVGVTGQGMLIIEATLSREDVQKLLDDWIAWAADRSAAEVLGELQQFLTTGEIPDGYADMAQQTMARVARGLTRLELAVNTGIDIAGGGRVAAAAKLRVDVSAYGGIGYTVDLLDPDARATFGLDDGFVGRLLREDSQDTQLELPAPADRD